ncbi:MAG: extracellular solute-binding protein [Oscillospiraceae bacterium]|nr:extracellular solute-binding protein [Oscillospiraceae bacterium]
MKAKVKTAFFLAFLLVVLLPNAHAQNSAQISGYITIWEHNYSYKDSLEAVISAFQKQYPDVEIEYTIKPYGDYDDLLKLAIQAGSGPDLFWTNGTATSTMGELVEDGVCLDLSDVVNFKFLSNNALDLGKVGNHIYSVPWMTMDTRTCYYNKDMFAENGWDVPKTLSEFDDLLVTIKEKGITPISLGSDSWCILFIFEPVLAAYDPIYCAAFQEENVCVTDKPARDTLNMLVRWAENGYYGDDWLSIADSDVQNFSFATEKTAMTVAGSWDAVVINKNNPMLNFGAFSIPSDDGTTGLVGTAANGFSVNSNSRSIDAAIAFADFCAGEEAQTIWVQTLGAVPGNDQIQASTNIAKEIAESGKGNIYKSWQSVLSHQSPSGEAFSIYERDILKVFLGEITVDDFMDSIAAAIVS